ncbi:MAG: phosphatidylserine decarboxylase [Kiritimatiellia bacterium]|jgi:phosphatidylserine decarboxylase
MKDATPDFSVTGALFPPIHPEGIRFGAVAIVLALLLTVPPAILCALRGHPMAAGIFAALALPLLLSACGVFLFFRDPERFPPEDDPLALLSPADGRVCRMRRIPLPPQIADEASKAAGDVWCVSVFMSVTNVHVNRAPAAARVVRRAYVPGKFVNASLDKASEDNERCLYLMETPDGSRFGVVQIAGLVARRIVSFAEEGTELARAERFGLIRFGSRLDVYLPPGIRPEVGIGQTMVAGETVLAHLPEA